MSGGAWVAQVICSARTAEKLAGLHGLAWRDVVEAVECVEGLDAAWNLDEGDELTAGRGWRLMVSTQIGGRPVLVILRDAGHPLGDVYNLVSAYHVD